MEQNYNLFIFIAIIIVIVVMSMMRNEHFCSTSYTNQFLPQNLMPMHYVNQTQPTLYYGGNGRYFIKRPQHVLESGF